MIAKGDRVARAASIETRYPFLDPDVITFCAGIAVCCGSMCRVTPCALNASTTILIAAGLGASL